ncbi:MAG: hypothetical protein J5742_03455 [Alphaproteobacteria bacterium]|nr:hypothetical protein [Alphaproteobacteria bacterium]
MSNIVYEKNVFSTPFLSGYDELRIPIINSDGRPVWPEVFPIEKIEKIRKTVGERHFLAQMMLDYVPSDKIRLDPGSIKLYDDDFDIHNSKLGENQITGMAIYWDPSSGRKNSDNSVCVLIYRDDKNMRVFVHDILYMIVPETVEYPLAYQCNQALEFVRRHHGHNIHVETNGIGGAFPEIMRTNNPNSQYKVQILPISNSRRKEDRILDTIEPLLSTGRLYAHRRITQTPLIAEMLAWTPLGSGEHDDGLDALAGAINAHPNVVRPMASTFQRYVANTNFKI